MKVLIVDDEDRLANALVKLLSQNKILADAVYNGEDGLDYALTGNYDVILLDIMMPKKDGFQVLKELRAKGFSTPVLLLSAKTETKDKITGLNIGADDYITKPFDSEELLARLNAISRRKGEYVGNSLTFGDLTLNKNTRELSVENSKTLLSGKEYEIMEMLMLSNNTIIEKEKFFQKIWGYDSEAEYNTIEVYISFLRRKLEALNSNVKIKTIRSVGYKLEKNA